MKPIHLASLLLILASFLHGARSVETPDLGSTTGPCADGKICSVDGYVGSNIIYEDDYYRVWDFILEPGQATSMHRHDYPYHFVALTHTQLEVWGEDGSRLFDFRAEGVMGFDIDGDYLKPIGIEFPWAVPRTHSSKNIGDETYYEILFETKTKGGKSLADIAAGDASLWTKLLPKKAKKEKKEL